MSRRFSFKPKAADDLEYIQNYLARNASVEVAERFVDVSDAVFERLAAMPEMGAIRRFANRELLRLRVWPLGSGFEEYLVFYRPNLAAKALRSFASCTRSAISSASSKATEGPGQTPEPR